MKGAGAPLFLPGGILFLSQREGNGGMRFLTAGESHGRGMLAIIEGFPANVPIDKGKITAVLHRRREAPGRSSRMLLETDGFTVLAGMRDGQTLGSPLAVSVSNAEWSKWETEMDPWDCQGRKNPVTVPRPGHADLAGAVKYGHSDIRAVAERASARDTVVRTVAGSFALQLLECLDVKVAGSVIAIGSGGEDNALKSAADNGDTVGGIVQVIINGLPGGIGSYTHWDRRLDSRLAAAILGIPAVKGVEFGQAFEHVLLPGSQYHDEFIPLEGRMVRHSNRTGGIEGGMTNGETVMLRAAVKPIPTLDRPLTSFDRITKQVCPAPVSRHDLSAVGAASVVAEAVCAWEIAACILEQMGGDTLEDVESRFFLYRRRWEDEISCPGK